MKINIAPYTSYHELAKKNNNSRVWLEGEPLLRAGYKAQGFFRVSFDIKKLTIRLHFVPDSPEARKLHREKKLRKVSGRKMKGWIKPIVDICNADVTQLFGEYCRFRAQAFSNGVIEFSVHPEELARVKRETTFLNNLEAGEIRKGDAFLGIGISSAGLAEGFANKGIRCRQVWAVEMEARYLDVACQNSPDVYQGAHLFAGKVEEIEKDLLEPVDAFSFSMPCTNHSLQGRAKKSLACAEDGNEVTALFGVVAMIKASNPALIFSENVPSAQNSTTYQLLKKELHRLGYTCQDMILDQSHSGALERRTRYWFVAYSNGLAIGDVDVAQRKRVYDTFGEIMETDAEYTGKWHDIEKLITREAVNKANGRNFAMSLLTPETRIINTLSRNITKHQVSNPVVPSNDLKAYRLPTINEHADIKLVPRRLIGHASATTAHEGLGQGIAYHHAVGLAEATAQKLLDKHASQSTLAF
ncbi:DNA cytosine methyltransferase [Alteromonas sp. 14N.309.X.WAT.G.H12]|uniref:DNA cytosine methyltransferase n=1 Tax=Alteromonas sp. 14N.309.X.WAT.G.H12 TaxID=3120824 RepID=UPI002FD0BDA5